MSLNLFFKLIFGLSFIYALAVSTPLSAQTYLLRPHGNSPHDLTDILPLSSKDEQTWLNTIYKQVSIQTSTDRAHLKNPEGESLDKILKSASQFYLELKLDEATKNLDSAMSLISKSTPYSGMREDLIEIFALRWMIIDAQKEIGGLVNDSQSASLLGLSDEVEFKSKLPLKIQNYLSGLKTSSTTLNDSELPAKSGRVFVFGREVKLPAKILAANILVHILNRDRVEGYWYEASSKKPMKNRWNKISSRPLWTLVPQIQLRAMVELARPKHLVPAGVTVMTHDGSGALSPRSIATSEESQLALSGLKIPATSNQWARDFQPDLRNSNDEATSLFKSPWFWMIAGTLAGAGGYLIYQSNQSTTTVQTR